MSFKNNPNSGISDIFRRQDPLLNIQGLNEVRSSLSHADVGMETHHTAVHSVRTEADYFDPVIREFQLMSQASRVLYNSSFASWVNRHGRPRCQALDRAYIEYHSSSMAAQPGWSIVAFAHVLDAKLSAFDRSLDQSSIIYSFSD